MNVPRLSIRQQLVLSNLWFALSTQYASMLAVVIPTQILLFVPSSQIGSAEQALFLGWLSTAASAISLIMPPIIGEISDHTPGKFGRRRPYIIAGCVLVVCSTPLLVLSSNLIIFLLGLSLLHVGMNITTPAYQSLMPDKVPKVQRGEASGYVGAMTILGNAVSLGLAAWLLGGINQQHYDPGLIRRNAGIYYIATAAAMVIGTLITVFGVREVPYTPQPMPPEEAELTRWQRFKHRFVHNWIDPWRKFNFTIVFLTRASIMLGLAMFMTFVEYYFARVQNITNFVQETAIVAVLALGGGVVSGVVFGLLSDHLKRRAPVVCGAAICMALASLAFVVFPTSKSSLQTWLWPLGIVFGLGYGAFSSVDWALSIDALPSLEEAGKDLGLWNASQNIPAILAPLIGGYIIGIAGGYSQTELGYRLVFLAATLFLVVAGFFILFMREKR